MWKLRKCFQRGHSWLILLLLCCSFAWASGDSRANSDESRLASGLNEVDRLLAEGKVNEAADAIRVIDLRLETLRKLFSSDDLRLSKIDVAEAYLLYFKGRVEYKRGRVCDAVDMFKSSYVLASGRPGGAGVSVISLSNALRVYSEINDRRRQSELIDELVAATFGGATLQSNVILSVTMQILIAYVDMGESEKSNKTFSSFAKAQGLYGGGDSAWAWKELGSAVVAQGKGDRDTAMRSYAEALNYFDRQRDSGGAFIAIYFANYSSLLRMTGQEAAANEALAKAEEISSFYTEDIDGIVKRGIRQRAGAEVDVFEASCSSRP